MTKATVDAYYTSEEITPDQYIEKTEQMRKFYLSETFRKARGKYPLISSKKKTSLQIGEASFKNEIKLAYVEGEIKCLEMFINLLIAHQHEDISLLFGSIELAIAKKLNASSQGNDINEMINRLVAVCESVKANYKGTKEEVQESINTFWEKPKQTEEVYENGNTTN